MKQRQDNIIPQITDPAQTILESTTAADCLPQQAASTEGHVEVSSTRSINTPAKNEAECSAVVAVDLGGTATEKDPGEDDKPKLWGDTRDMISADQKQIFDPKTQSMIDMPTDAKEQKTALEAVFFHFTRVLWYRKTLFDVADLFKRVPQELWNTHFTPEQTDAMREAQIQRIMEEQTARGLIVFKELLELEEFKSRVRQVVPANREELEEARSREQSDARVDMIKEVFCKSERAEDWINLIFEKFKDALGSDYTLAEGSRFREYTASRIANTFEKLFSGWIFRDIENELGRGRSFNDMFTDAAWYYSPSADYALLPYLKAWRMQNIDKQ